jgi:hypothetical protein
MSEKFNVEKKDVQKTIKQLRILAIFFCRRDFGVQHVQVNVSHNMVVTSNTESAVRHSVISIEFLRNDGWHNITHIGKMGDAIKQVCVKLAEYLGFRDAQQLIDLARVIDVQDMSISEENKRALEDLWDSKYAPRTFFGPDDRDSYGHGPKLDSGFPYFRSHKHQ